MKKEFTVVILSAGMGTRLGDLTKDYPKSLQKVDGKSIVQYDIAWAKYLGARKIIVIGGYKIDKLKEEIRGIDKEVKVVENDDYKTTQRMTSLLKAEGLVEGDMLVLDGDYIYHKDVADYILENNYDFFSVHASKEKSKYMVQDVIVEVDENNRFLNNFKTKDTKDLVGDQMYFNSLLYCPEKCLDNFFDTAKSIITDLNNNQVHLEDVVLAYSKKKIVDVKDAGKPLWMEIDTPEELNSAEKFVGKYKKDIPS